MSIFDKKFLRFFKRIYYPLGLIIILIIILSVLSFSPSDGDEINSKINLLGGFGYNIASSLFWWFGYAFYFLILFFISFFIFTFPKAFRILSIDQIIGEILLLFSFTILLSLYNPVAGGYIGNTLSSIIEYLLGKVGVYIILLLMIISSIASIIKFNLFSINTYTILYKQLVSFINWIKLKVYNFANRKKDNSDNQVKKEGLSLFNQDSDNEKSIVKKLEYSSNVNKANINDNTKFKEDYLFQQYYDFPKDDNNLYHNSTKSNCQKDNTMDFFFLDLINIKDNSEKMEEQNFNFINSIINKKSKEELKNNNKSIKSFQYEVFSEKEKKANTMVITKNENEEKQDKFLEDEFYLSNEDKMEIDKELNIKLEEDWVDVKKQTKQIKQENDCDNNIMASIEDDDKDENKRNNEEISIENNQNQNKSSNEKEDIKDIIFEDAFIDDEDSYSNHSYLKENFKHFRVSKFKKEDHRDEIDIMIKNLEKTLNEFKIEAKVTGVSRGPVITRFEIQPAPGIKLSKIVSLADNISLSLGGVKIRIIAPIPGKSAVGIEVPNKSRDMVRLGDIFVAEDFKNNEANLPIVLGRDISGKIKIADSVHMPHLLVAGSTNSGKSVCINSIICSLLYAKGHDEVKFILVDPKIVELKIYNDLPNLLTPVITEPKKASLALKWLVNEMLRRYKLLESYSSRNILNYNRKISKLEQHNMDADERLNYIVLIIDEFADLMMVAKKEVEESISRLAAMARAVGIHLILATQRPSTDIITGTIKSNFPARVGFMVSSYYDSKTILDNPGAEKLLGRGDMLFFTPGLGSPERIQGTFVSEEEIIKMMDNLKKMGKPDYIDDMFDLEEESAGSDYDDDFDEPLWEEAVNIVINDKKASASYLQRKLKIGYNRAARIVEFMEKEGIVGPEQGSKPRDVLIDEY